MKQYVVDAFTDRVFSGNPAAICIMDEWIPDELMAAITKENNLSETAFAVREGDRYKLRWFTPGGEIDLCGHATLACAFVIMNYYELCRQSLSFETKSGLLTVVRSGELYEMDFPAYALEPVEITPEMTEAVGAKIVEAWMGRDLLCVLEDEEAVRAAAPAAEALKKLNGLLLHITAPYARTGYDSISRSFAPKLNVYEDPVCGSGHCHIVPYWAERKQTERITAYQASPRGGTLYCRMDGDRVKLSGEAVLYSIAELNV